MINQSERSHFLIRSLMVRRSINTKGGCDRCPDYLTARTNVVKYRKQRLNDVAGIVDLAYFMKMARQLCGLFSQIFL
jgi:hypothetical protein